MADRNGQLGLPCSGSFYPRAEALVRVLCRESKNARCGRSGCNFLRRVRLGAQLQSHSERRGVPGMQRPVWSCHRHKLSTRALHADESRLRVSDRDWPNRNTRAEIAVDTDYRAVAPF
jgi:hypothetical protein